jgi:glycosyltransferase involved in cell wall biosynthesis
MISIIIPTFNGKNKLEKLLRSLELQSNKNFEIIIVVDGSTDGTIGLKANNWDLNIKWIEETNNGRAGARNRPY